MKRTLPWQRASIATVRPARPNDALAYTSSTLRVAASGLESDGLRLGPFRASSSGSTRLTGQTGHGPETRPALDPFRDPRFACDQVGCSAAVGIERNRYCRRIGMERVSPADADSLSHLHNLAGTAAGPKQQRRPQNRIAARVPGDGVGSWCGRLASRPTGTRRIQRSSIGIRKRCSFPTLYPSWQPRTTGRPSPGISGVGFIPVGGYPRRAGCSFIIGMSGSKDLRPGIDDPWAGTHRRPRERRDRSTRQMNPETGATRDVQQPASTSDFSGNEARR